MKNNIRKIRESKNLTQKELGILLHIDTKTVYRHEKGIIKLTENTIAAYAKALNCPPSAIITSEWAPQSQEIDINTLKEAIEHVSKSEIDPRTGKSRLSLELKSELIALWYNEKVKENNAINKGVTSLHNIS